MIYNNIFVQEYADLLVDARREEVEIAAESAFMEAAEEDGYQNFNKDMVNSIKTHLKMVKTYIRSATKKKKSGLYKESKEDLRKARAELDATEKTIRSMESTNSDAIKSVITSVFFTILVSVAGFAYGFAVKNEKDRTLAAIHGEFEIDEREQVNRIMNICSNCGFAAGTVSAIAAAVKTFNMIMNARKEMKKGASTADAYNQYKVVYLKFISQMKKVTDQLIREVDIIIKADER